MNAPDLLVQLLDLWISRGDPPDVMSKEWDGDDTLKIRFEWFTGRCREYPYSKQRFDAVWEAFNRYWNLRKEAA